MQVMTPYCCHHRLIGPHQSDYEKTLCALVRPLRRRMSELGISQGQLALRMRCDRSRVTRALSGRDLPPLNRVEQIAGMLGSDVAKARRRWRHAAEMRQKQRQCFSNGGPPGNLHTYTEFLKALDALRVSHGLTHRELVRRDLSGTLKRSTVGAVLRGERIVSRTFLPAYVRACGASTLAEDAWISSWWALAHPVVQEARQRQRQGLDQKVHAISMKAFGYAT